MLNGVIMLPTRDIDYLMKIPVPGMRKLTLSCRSGEPKRLLSLTSVSSSMKTLEC